MVIQLPKPNLIPSRNTEAEHSTETDTKTNTENQIRSTALERSVIYNITGRLNRLNEFVLGFGARVSVRIGVGVRGMKSATFVIIRYFKVFSQLYILPGIT